MKIADSNFLLRTAIAFILIMHSVPGMFNNSVYEFGQFYLNENGFSPLGVPIAWAIKISHFVCAILLVLNQFVKPAAIVTIFILITGIVMVHFQDGWYVVGAGRNGIEFNFLMIIVLLTIMYPNDIKNK